MNKYIDALFGAFKDAYMVLGQGTTILDPLDTAIVLTENDTFQLYIPANEELSDRGLAIVEIYNAMCRDKAGTVDKQGRPIPENAQYAGFAAGFAARMKVRVGE